jgi:hypothetical protein
MAEAAAPAKGIGATLSKKVGPFPLGVWAAAGLAGVWYYERKKAAAASSNPAAAQSQTGYGTDPAGNTGYIDPQSGYVYGSAEDIAALQSQGLVGQNQYAGGSGNPTSGSGASGSSDTSGQTTGTTNGSGTSTTTPGAPPGPTTTTPGSSSGGSATWSYPAPKGLQAVNISDSGFGLTWQPVQGPQGQHPSTYTVATYQLNGVKVDQFQSGSTSTKQYGPGGKGLHPGWQYRTDVWANGGPRPGAHASTVTTVKPKGTK